MPDALSGFGEGTAGLVDIVAIGSGDGITMWVELGEPQEPVEPFHQFFRFDVLQLLGDIVYLVPAETQLVKQERFPEPMPPDDGHGQIPDRQSDVTGESVSGRVDLGGGRTIKKKQ